MALLLLMPGRDTHDWKSKLLAKDPDLDVRIWPDVGKADEILMTVVWNQPPGALKKFKNLRCVASLGAGVDHILADPDLPAGVAVTRIVDEQLNRMMAEYVTLAVLHHYRQFDRYEQHKQRAEWKPEPPPNRGFHVGVMGLGVIGGHVAQKLSEFGFSVLGWARSRKSLPGIRSFAGDAELGAFASLSNILVCLLPLTPQTRGILNQGLFSMLPRGAYVVNVARGEHLVEEDLLAAIGSGQLSGACLDVFRQEPLPPEHPFWRHPKIMVTPHIASVTQPENVAAQIVENYRRLLQEKPLLHQVDIRRGY
ncbi:MAG TPA: glyoxylate/hydroxypyruvate reductase A [Bacteroidetes bacterium]|nr:glyoxylate/hydroxypyruvate reductase A [Bacteroidota bacterium]